MKKYLLTILALLLIVSSAQAITYEKVDGNTLKVTATTVREVSIEYSELVAQRDKFQAAVSSLTIQYADEIARMQLILDELNKRVVEADKLSIVAKPKPVEPVVVEEEEEEKE